MTLMAKVPKKLDTVASVSRHGHHIGGEQCPPHTVWETYAHKETQGCSNLWYHCLLLFLGPRARGLVFLVFFFVCFNVFVARHNSNITAGQGGGVPFFCWFFLIMLFLACIIVLHNYRVSLHHTVWPSSCCSHVCHLVERRW